MTRDEARDLKVGARVASVSGHAGKVVYRNAQGLVVEWSDLLCTYYNWTDAAVWLVSIDDEE